MTVWMDAPSATTGPDNFYDSTVEQYALLPLEVLSLRQVRCAAFCYVCAMQIASSKARHSLAKQMLEFGKEAMHDKAKVLKSARHVQREVCLPVVALFSTFIFSFMHMRVY